jgi:division protein CdvB (Snf7/Vps24/ESCRT-III family)
MQEQTKYTDEKIGELLHNGTPQSQIAAETGLTAAKISTLKQQYLNAYLLDVEQKKHQATKIQLTNANTKAVTAEALRSENEQLKQQIGTLKAAKTKLQATDNELQVTAEKLQASETNLQEVVKRLQQSETNLQEVTERLQVSDAKLQEVTTNETELTKHLQVSDAKLQEVTTKLQDTRQQLQEVEEERDQYGATLQSLVYIRKPILEQRTLTHPRFLLWAIFFFEGYNGWQLYENMKLQQFPYFMAFVFATFFGLASVTALAANHRWGVILCVTAAFFSNAIHADLFTYPSLQGGFYTLLPCLLILLFADMYKKTNII